MMLGALGFPKYFCQKVHTLMNNVKAWVEVNGTKLEPFELSRSMRQACPLTPALYVSAADALLYLLRDHTLSPRVSGVLPPKSEDLTNIQLVHDMKTIVQLSESNVYNLRIKLNLFYNASKSQVSLSKSVMLGWDHPLLGAINSH